MKKFDNQLVVDSHIKTSEHLLVSVGTEFFQTARKTKQFTELASLSTKTRNKEKQLAWLCGSLIKTRLG